MSIPTACRTAAVGAPDLQPPSRWSSRFSPYSGGYSRKTAMPSQVLLMIVEGLDIILQLLPPSPRMNSVTHTFYIYKKEDSFSAAPISTHTTFVVELKELLTSLQLSNRLSTWLPMRPIVTTSLTHLIRRTKISGASGGAQIPHGRGTRHLISKKESTSGSHRCSHAGREDPPSNRGWERVRIGVYRVGRRLRASIKRVRLL